MTDRDRRGWIIVGAICVTMFFIWGAINSTPVFFVPVLKYFGWTRAKLSTALSIGWVTGGAAGPLIGWLADRVNPKKMMIVGAAVTGVLLVLLSRFTTFEEFLAINGLFGISVGAATTIPCSIVIAGWFERRRGLAIGIAFAAAPIGGAAMAPLVNYINTLAGWRSGYFALALPILFIVVPLVLLLVRPANPGDDAAATDTATAAPIQLPGFELWRAMKTRSFWLICAAQFLIGGGAFGMGPHYVAYLTGVGYGAAFAATAWSLFLVMTTVGALLGGPFADRAGARTAIVATCILGALGLLGLIGASHALGLAVNILASGFALGALGVQMPLVIIESLGVKRLGSLMGVTGVFLTISAAVSPIVAGRIYDLTGRYEIAIGSFVVMLTVSAVALLGCRTLASEEAHFTASASAAA
jgi:MFS family permease